MTGQRGLDTSICFGAADAGWVRVLAGHLFDAGLTSLLDEWHPGRADLVALRMSQGYREARYVLLVIGPGTDATVLDHYRAMLAPPHESPHVVVCHGDGLMRGDVQLPDFVADAPLVDFRPAESYDQRVRDLVDIIGPLAPHPRPRPGGGSARLRISDDRVVCSTGDGADLTASIAVDWHRFNELLWSRQRREPEALRAIGSALGATFTPDPIGRGIEDAVSAVHADGGTLTISVRADGELGELPWETLILPGHEEPLGLHPATRVYRTHGGPATDVAPAPGPLRILAVLACPDDGAPMDHERELAALVDALEPARKYHGAEVRILNEGTAAAIDEALGEQPWHVLHLACHAQPGALLWEDGSAVPPEVAATVGSRVGLVVLSGPWSAQAAPGIESLSGLARNLLAAGTPQVLVMTAPTTSRFTTALFAGVYRELALASTPQVLDAVAHGRRDAERRRLAEVASTGRPVPAEWATPALYHRDQPTALYDPSAPARPAATRAAGFAGRRCDLRRLLGALRQPDHPAVLLHGMTGVGKSALAAAAVRRLGPSAGTVVSLSGALTADRLLTTIGTVDRAWAEADPAADAPVLVWLDNMEANLVHTGDDQWVLADPRLAEVLTRLGGRLLMTSRRSFDLPGDTQLWRAHVGPLTWAEARMFMWGLPALDTLSLTDQQKSYVDSGGHPGTLEVLDTLLRRPGATFADLRQRMERLLLDRKIDRPELWMAQVGRHGVDTSLAEAVTSAVYAALRSDAG